MTRDALEFIDTRNVYWCQRTPAHVTQASKQVLKQVRFSAKPRRMQTLVNKTLRDMERLYKSK